MENQTAEVLVLGAGPGGYTAAFRAADLGQKVVLVDSGAALGGVCLNVGCIPSKALLHAAKVIAETREMGENGVSFGPPTIDLDRLRAWKDAVVGRLTGGPACHGSPVPCMAASSAARPGISNLSAGGRAAFARCSRTSKASTARRSALEANSPSWPLWR